MDYKPPKSDREENPTEWAAVLHHAILESALDCIITMDSAGLVREFNPAAERLFGYSRTEVMGRELAELIIPPSLRERHRMGLKRYLRTGEGPVLGKRIEITGMRSDGSEVLVELAITACQMKGQAVFTAYLRDITDRHLADQAKQRLAAIVQSSDDAIIGSDLDGIITSWNAGAERLFGYGISEILGKSLLLLLPEERQQEETTILSQIRRGEHVAHFETIRRRKDGSLLNVSLSVSPIKDNEGRVVGASKISRDVTAQVQAERRRTAQYAVASLLGQARTLSDVAAEVIRTIAEIGNWVAGAIWLCDNNCETLNCSATWNAGGAALEEFSQVSRATALAHRIGLPGRVVTAHKPAWITDVVTDENFPRASAAASAGLHGGFAFPLIAYEEIKGVLELFSPEAAQPDRDLLQFVEALGSLIGLFINRQQIEEELQQQKESAEAANAAKDRFLAALSHELRTPLNPVLIWAGGTAKEKDLPADLREGLEMVCRNVELEARLIDDLLDLTRIARGKVILRKQTVDAHELLRHAIAIVHSETASRKVEEEIDLAAPEHHIFVDSSRVQQAFWNVLRNAYKFTPDKGRIVVRTHNNAPGQWTVEFRDTGVGIEKNALKKIFDAFEQVDTQREGLGLGLAIAKAIVEMHGGTIRAESGGLGAGASFIIELALAQ